MSVERHPLRPFLPPHAQLLMLGSFPPPQKRWSMEFYYPNWNNDMWRITGWIFFHDKSYFEEKGRKAFCKEKLVNFLIAKGIALFDTALSIRRLQENASDKYLQVVETTNLSDLLAQLPFCRAVVTTGEKATDILSVRLAVEKPCIGEFTTFLYEERPIRFYRMPSSSRAYPLALEKKAIVYHNMYQELQLI